MKSYTLRQSALPLCRVHKNDASCPNTNLGPRESLNATHSIIARDGAAVVAASSSYIFSALQHSTVAVVKVVAAVAEEVGSLSFLHFICSHVVSSTSLQSSVRRGGAVVDDCRYCGNEKS